MLINLHGWTRIFICDGEVPYMIRAEPWGMRDFPAVELLVRESEVQNRIERGFFEHEALMGSNPAPHPATILA